ncbi:transcriptional regulator [Streptomyces sp. M19]
MSGLTDYGTGAADPAAPGANLSGAPAPPARVPPPPLLTHPPPRPPRRGYRPTDPALDALADARATGALLCDAGTLYLADGLVVHAESPAAPGVEILLTAPGAFRPTCGARRSTGPGPTAASAATSSRPALSPRGAGTVPSRRAVRRGVLRARPDSGPTRFRRGVRHWLGGVRPVPARTVGRETRRRAALLDTLWPYPRIDRAPVVPRAYAARHTTLTRRQRAVLDLADGVRTPRASPGRWGARLPHPDRPAATGRRGLCRDARRLGPARPARRTRLGRGRLRRSRHRPSGPAPRRTGGTPVMSPPADEARRPLS